MHEALVVSVGGTDDIPWGNSVVEQLLAESEELLNGLDYGDAKPSSPKRKAVRPKRSRNSTRDRQQSELQFLRRHVSELTEELQRLTHRSIAPNGERASALRTGTIVSAWQRLAQRQHKARGRSEQENYSLRSQVVQRTKLLRGIQELLQLHRRHATEASPFTLTTLQTTSGFDNDVSMCAHLKKDAANLFARTSAVLSEQIDPNQTGILSMTQRVDLEHSQLVARLQTSRVFPFDVHATTTALWRALPSVFMTHSDTTTDRTEITSRSSDILSREYDARLVERSDSVYAVSYSVPLTVGGTTLLVRVRDVVTRYDCDTSRKSSAHSKSVFIWQTALESYSSSSTHGVHVPPIGGSGWLVLDQDPHACRSSVLRSVFEFRTPTLTTTTPRSDAMDAWVSLGEACMDNVVLQVDKRLLA